MAASDISGPVFVRGNLHALTPAQGGFVPDYNPDAGPGAEYIGDGILDARYFYPKDKLTGFTGVAACHFNVPALQGINGIPAALASNNIAGAQTVTSGVAMTMAAASVGVSVNIPIRPWSGVVAGASPVTAAMMLDFGFEFGNCTAGSPNITVANGNDFFVGMPLVIAGVGNAAGTAPLLTQVLSVNLTTNVITVPTTVQPLATNTAAAIGTGDLWGPSVNAFPLPLAAQPMLAFGPGLWMDPRQTITRGVRVTGVSGGTGGTFTIRGWDIYGQPMSETITVGAGAVTGWSKKAFKSIASATPNFTDSTHNYSVGTSDVFGFSYRAPFWEQTEIFWAGAYMNSSTGFTVPDDTNPATALRGDVRGTVQVSTNGGGSGIGSTASNGTVSALTMTGNRYASGIFPLIFQAATATAANPYSLYGQTQA